MSWLQVSYVDEEGKDQVRNIETAGESRIQVAGVSGFEWITFSENTSKAEFFAGDDEPKGKGK